MALDLGIPTKEYKAVQKSLGKTYHENSVLFLPTLTFPSENVASAQVKPGCSLMRPPHNCPVVITLNSFPGECSPALAADAQDQEAENDDRGKLHPATESNRHMQG